MRTELTDKITITSVLILLLIISKLKHATLLPEITIILLIIYLIYNINTIKNITKYIIHYYKANDNLLELILILLVVIIVIGVIIYVYIQSKYQIL